MTRSFFHIRTSILLLLLPAVLLTGTAFAAGEKTLNRITEIEWQETATEFSLRVQSESPPEYSMYELFKPLRVIINIKDARISDKLSLPLKPKAGPVVYVKGRSFDTMTPPIARIELFLAEDHEYSVALDRNDLVVRFGKEMPSSPASAPLAAKADPQGKIAATPAILAAQSEQLDKKLYKDLFEQGKKYFNAADYEKAYATFFKAFELDPANLSLNFILGRAAYEMGDYEAAVMAFERILIADPEVVRVKLELAKSYYLLGSFETATTFFEELLDADLPDSVKKNIEAFLAQQKEAVQ